MVDDFLLTVKEVARELKVSRQVLWKWRSSGSPPEFRKCNLTGKLRYSASSVLAAKQSMFKESHNETDRS